MNVQWLEPPAKCLVDMNPHTFAHQRVRDARVCPNIGDPQNAWCPLVSLKQTPRKGDQLKKQKGTSHSQTRESQTNRNSLKQAPRKGYPIPNMLHEPLPQMRRAKPIGAEGSFSGLIMTAVAFPNSFSVPMTLLLALGPHPALQAGARGIAGWMLVCWVGACCVWFKRKPRGKPRGHPFVTQLTDVSWPGGPAVGFYACGHLHIICPLRFGLNVD